MAGGDALGRLDDGRVVFVPGALPGEDVVVHLVEERRDFARATLVRVATPHTARVAPECALVAAGCGGCDWQHLAADAQPGEKVEIVREALRRTAKLDPVWLQPGGGVPPWGYRTTMRFAATPPDTGGWSRPGLRRPRSNDVVAVGRCPVAHPSLDALLGDLHLRDVDEVTLRVSVASGQATAWWTSSGGPRDRRRRPRGSTGGRGGGGRRQGTVTGLPAHVTTGPDTVLVERVEDVDLRVSASAFFQSGPDAAELLVRTVRELAGDELDGAGRVVDLYGGIGLFAATVVPPSAEVVLVESSAAACRDAEVNLAGRPATIVPTQVEEWVPTGADVVIADPARQGLGRDAAERVVAVGAPTVVLVSCDPVAGARDLATLGAAGYEVTAARVLDLFPETHHVELVTRLDRSGAARRS